MAADCLGPEDVLGRGGEALGFRGSGLGSSEASLGQGLRFEDRRLGPFLWVPNLWEPHLVSSQVAIELVMVIMIVKLS